MQHASHRKKKKRLQLSIVAQFTLVLIAVVLLFVTFSQYALTQQGAKTDQLKSALLGDTARKANVSFDSALGFSIPFNKKQLTSVGYVINQDQTFKTYDGDDALTKRDYAIANIYDVRLKSKENVKTANYSSAEFNLTTSILNDFFEKRRAQYGQQLSELELTEKHFAPKTSGTQTVTQVKSSDITISGVVYKKVVYKIVDTKLLTTTSTTEAYYLVKNKKPFAITITHANDKDQEFVGSLRNIITGISYGTKQQSAQYGTQNSSSGGKVSGRAAATSLNTPYDLDESTVLEIVAKNQPATVRVGTVYCAKVSLKLTNGQSFTTFERACNGGIGSGSIISQEGYVSTNGHVTTLKPNDLILFALLGPLQESDDIKPLRTFMEYLYANGQAPQADELVQLIQDGDADAVTKLSQVIDAIPREQLGVTDDKYDFAIQLGKTPLKLNLAGAQMSYAYKKDAVVHAKLVDKNFNIYDDIASGQFTSSDVAVLKITDKVTGGFPVAKLGSIDGIKKGDLVTAIGFPAFVDGGTETKQKYTYPTATQGKVLEVGYDADDAKRKLVSMTTPVAQGNSGGPAFSTTGSMVGLNTYANGGGVDSFSLNSTFRDVADLKQLLKKNSITVSGSSSLSSQWATAIDDFAQSNYQDAKATFDEVIKTYPSFYLAESFADVANKEIQIQNKANILKFTIAGIVFVIVCMTIGIVVFIRRLIVHNRTAAEVAPLPTQQPVAQQQAEPPIHFDQYPSSQQTSPPRPQPSPPKQPPTSPNMQQQDENDPWRGM